jgi:hypothetical protein
MTGPITSKHIFWLFLNYVIDNFVFETFSFADCERRVKTYLGFLWNFRQEQYNKDLGYLADSGMTLMNMIWLKVEIL